VTRAVLVVAVVLGAAMTSCSTPVKSPPTSVVAAAATTVPPPSEPSSLALEVGCGVLKSGETVAITPGNAGSEDATLGVAAEVFRWTGRDWVKVKWVRLCPDLSTCGTLFELAPSTTVPPLPIPVPANGRGSAELLHLDGLAPGHCQLMQKGAEDAAGEFEIVG
jgi:hypothetical protein